MVDRVPADHLRPNLVLAGFPCQPFSALGLQQGWNDVAGRGTLVEHTFAFIKHHLPEAILLENVAAFGGTGNGTMLRWRVSNLEMNSKYNVEHRILCTSRFGLPQTRRRWHLIALRTDIIA